ncbi:MAG: lactonase family protein [Verrucomicrobiota bacterium JB023]|nr:lactonase family protein [Verrucomicrobiota bacterium JB023]
MPKLSFLASLLAMSLPATAETVDLFISSAPEGIYQASFDTETGELDNLRPVAEFAGGGFLALHPSKPLLFSTSKHEQTGSAKSFSITPEGLTELSESTTQGRGTCQISLNHTGSLAFVANYSSGSAASFTVDEQGQLSQEAGFAQHEGSSSHPNRQTAPHAHATVVGPDNNFLYVPDLGIDKVMIYRIDPSGALEPAGHGQLPKGSGPRHMKFSRDGNFAYVLNELSLTVTTFRRAKDSGALDAIETISVLPDGEEPDAMTCAEIRVHPNGKYLYTSLRDLKTRISEEIGGNTLTSFAVKEDGTLERIQVVSAGVRIPRNFNLDPTGKWLIVGGQASHDIRVFSVGSDGKLTLTGRSYPCPAPICFEFRP